MLAKPPYSGISSLLAHYLQQVKGAGHSLYCIFLLAFAVVAPVSVQAQVGADSLTQQPRQQGKMFLSTNFGTGVGFRSDRLAISNSTALFDIAVNPKVGYFLIDNLVVGAAVDIYGSVASYNYLEDYRVFFHTYHVFGRYYAKGGFFGELQMGLGSGHESSTMGNGSTIRNQLGIRNYALGAGASFDWSPNVSFELMLRYRLATATFKDVSAEFQLNGFNVMAGISVAPW